MIPNSRRKLRTFEEACSKSIKHFRRYFMCRTIIMLQTLFIISLCFCLFRSFHASPRAARLALMIGIASSCLTILATYSMEQSSSWEANQFPVKKFTAFYRGPKFITAFTSARHHSLSWASSIQSIPPRLILATDTVVKRYTITRVCWEHWRPWRSKAYRLRGTDLRPKEQWRHVARLAVRLLPTVSIRQPTVCGSVLSSCQRGASGRARE